MSLNPEIAKLLDESDLLKYTNIIVPEYQKFAELLIEACISKINDLKDITSDEMISQGYRNWGSYSGALDRAEDKIRNHFGVKQCSRS